MKKPIFVSSDMDMFTGPYATFMGSVIDAWELNGLTCYMREIYLTTDPKEIERLKGRMRISWLCGYVALPKGHPLYGKSNYKLDDLVTVHGGVTFAANVGDSWVVGFDTNHYGDGDFWNRDRVRAETGALAVQLADLGAQ